MFLSVDPVTAYSHPVGQFHRYRYANNNPFRFKDPDGRLAFLIPVAYAAYRIYSAHDAVTSGIENVGTVLDSSASVAERITAGGEVVGSAIGGKLGRRLGGRVAQMGSKLATKDKPRIRAADVSDPGAKVPNYKINMSKEDFDQHLTDNGLSKADIPTSNGPVSVYSKDGVKQITTREFAKSTKEPSGEIFRDGQQAAKIRFKDDK